MISFRRSIVLCAAFLVAAASASSSTYHNRQGRSSSTRPSVSSSASRYSSPSHANGSSTTRGGATGTVTIKKATAAVVAPFKTISMKTAVISGVLLAFNSGFINGACLSGGIAATKQAVAAVTGAYTTGALGAASGDYEFFKKQAGIILSYLGGSAIAGMMNPTPTAWSLSPSTGPLFLLGSALLVASSTMADKLTEGGNAMPIFFLAAMANGIQNSITSVHTGNLIRSAHYSGMTSDMGTFLGQVIRGNKTNLYRLKVCAALAVAFWTGGYIAYFATDQYAQTTLLFSAALYALIGAGLMLQ